ncbi:MAG: tyrosine--tRNA ligase [Planctomycetales bacterium]|nr:tyrosine--tRNA ligase [Planctomycetales bacterium]
MSDIYSELSWRGLINQVTDEQHIPNWLKEGSRTAYVGFDPTADSLHLGSLLPLLYLRRFQKAGHKPIALVGGATGMIGDPSGKSQERNLLSVEQLEANVEGMRNQMARFLDFDCGDNSAVLVNNFDWMKDFSYLEFLRDIGKNFPVNVMLAKDSVKGRLERTDSGLSYTEFSYMLLQAFDFVHLNQKYGCELQIGGSDQWGNITAGIDLGRRMHSVQLYGITCPLLTKADGTKMGKTESGTVWLSPDRTSPYEFYQYLVRVADEDAGMCLRFLTELTQNEIAELDKAREESPQQRDSQRRLAEELTRLVHGEDGLATAQRATEIFFGAEISDLNDAQLASIFADVPSNELPRTQLSDGLPLIDALVASGLSKSKGEARRTIQQGGAYVNNRRETEIDATLDEKKLASETTMVLRSGKRNYALLRFV